jgi:hypothetical protein
MHKAPARQVVEMLLASAGPFTFSLRAQWPMHQAIRELHQSASASGLVQDLPQPLELKPSPDVGIELVGGGKALRDILREEGLEVIDASGQLTPTPAFLTEARRRLMTVDPTVAALYRAAGLKWAALTSTASKNWATAARSSGSTVRTEIPKRANAEVGEAACKATARRRPA